MNQDDAVFGETFQVLFLWGKKRHYPRYPLNVPVEFVVEDERQSEQAEQRAEGRDISLGGVRLLPPETNQSVPQVGSRVRLQMFVEGINKPFNLEGEVVHADAEQGFGVSFADLPTELRQRLKWLLTMRAVREDEDQ